MKTYNIYESRYCAIRGRKQTKEEIKANRDDEAIEIFQDKVHGWADFTLEDPTGKLISYTNAHLCG